MIRTNHNEKLLEETKIYKRTIMHREINKIKSRIKLIKTKNLSLNSNGSTNMKSNNKFNLNKITCHPILKPTYKIINNSLLSLFSLHKK